jgi:hypothetical protein
LFWHIHSAHGSLHLHNELIGCWDSTKVLALIEYFLPTNQDLNAPQHAHQRCHRHILYHQPPPATSTTNEIIIIIIH